MRVFTHASELPCSAARLFRYHAAPLAFARLTPPWEDVVVEEPLARLADGERAVLRVGVGPVRVRWVARHEEVRDGKDGGAAGFVDVMEQGPFSAWRHEHRIEPLGPERCRLTDRVTWQGPLGGRADDIAGGAIERKLARLFRYRHDTIRHDLALLTDLPDADGVATRPLVIGVTGASGLVGSEVCALLSVAGHTVRRFVRRAARADDELAWEPIGGHVDPRASGLDAVIHLAGENIAEGRLDDEKRARLREQRVEQTARLFARLAALERPPRVVVSASAIGFYGDRGDDVLDEKSPTGRGFLARLCADWERAALSPPSPFPWRTVVLRTGIVLSPRGGALRKALPPFLAGVGGVLGDGRAWMPALTVDDMAAIVLRAVADERLHGVVCAVGSAPVTQRTWAETLGRVLGRPVLLPVPRAALRLALGDVADHILESCRVVPTALTHVGHRFRHASLDEGLRHVLGR